MDQLKLAAVSRNYFNMPFWVGLHAGLFRAEGLNVTLELHEGVDAVTDRLRDGHVDLACGITEHVVLDREAGGDLVIIGGNVNRMPFSLIASKSIRTIPELRGQVVGVSSLDAGSSSLVMKLLAAHGLHYPGDYELRAVGPILARWELLQSGAIQAGLQGAPFNYIAVDQGYSSLCEVLHEIPEFQFTSLNVLRGWAQTSSPLLLRFMRAFVAAHRWFYANREAASDIAQAECSISAGYARRAWDEFTTQHVFPPDGDASTTAVQALIDISALIRAVPDRQNRSADDYIDRSYIRQAQRELGAAA